PSQPPSSTAVTGTEKLSCRTRQARSTPGWRQACTANCQNGTLNGVSLLILSPPASTTQIVLTRTATLPPCFHTLIPAMIELEHLRLRRGPDILIEDA